MKNDLPQTLQELLDQSHITVYELAKRSGLQQSVVLRIINGETQNPGIHTLRRMAKFFNVTISQLIGESPLRTEANTNELNLKDSQLVHIPIVAWNKVVDWLSTETKPETGNYVVTNKPIDVPEQSFALKLEDGHLEPRFSKGTIFIFDQSEPKSRDLVLVSSENNRVPMLKKVIREGSEIYLKSLNPELANIEPTKLATTEKILAVMIQAQINNF